MEIKEIYIKNFRNIGEEGAEIKLSPITIFTGCNSAGKSTAAKALLLLEAFLLDLKTNNYNLIDTPLDFSRVVKLGTFDTVLNKASKNNGQEDIILGYSFASAILVADIHVRFIFGKRDTDGLKNGWLKELKILIDSDELLSISINKGYYCFNCRNEEKFLEYVRCYKIRHIVSYWREKEIMRVEQEDISKKLNPISTNIKDIELDELRPKMSELLAIESKLTKDGVIRKVLRNSNRDEEYIKQALRLPEIISAIENIIDLNIRDFIIYNTEASKGRRLNNEDIPQVCEKIEESYKKVFEKVNGFYDGKYFNKQKIKYEGHIYDYINSEYSSYIDFKRHKINFNEIIKDLNNIESQDFASGMVGNTSGKLDEAGILDICKYSSNSDSVNSALNFILSSILNPSLCGKLGYVDASTVDVKRLYPLDLSDSFGNLWKRYNNMKAYHKFSVKHEKGAFMRKWLQAFGICDELIVENLEGMLRIKLISKENPEGRLLADYGYGVTQLIALLLNIEIAINCCEDTIESLLDDPLDDGIISTIPYRLILEEPEVHLHPCLQSQLADLFLDAYRHGVEFVVETHSEYLVRRTQVLVASRFNKKPKYIPSFRIYYFPENDKPYDMGFQRNGKFIENFGTGFFDVADNSAMDLFEFEEE